MKRLSGLILTVLLSLAAIVCLAWVPAKYQWAELLFSQGRYTQAGALYESVNYRDSREKADECGYRLAQGLFAAENYAAAGQLFQSLGGYRQAALLTAACECLADGTGTDSLRQIAASLEQERSAPEILRKTRYILASLDLNRGEAARALERFTALGDFADSAGRLESCRAVLYGQALEEMNTRRFQEALEAFDGANRHEQSALLEKYCRLRLAGSDYFDPERILTEENCLLELFHGKMYYYHPVYVYVPNERSADTGFMVYFAGGNGEYMLYIDDVYDYLWNYAPDAVIVFYENSGLPDLDGACRNSIRIANQAAAECGIGIHDLVIGGSSNGCYTALRAAAAFYTDNAVAAKAVLTLDTGQDWASTSLSFPAWQREETAEAGIPFYLFEQAWEGANVEGIRDLIASGNSVTAVYCAHDEHNEITTLAFQNGVFSWALGETAELQSSEYSLVPLSW